MGLMGPCMAFFGERCACHPAGDVNSGQRESHRGLMHAYCKVLGVERKLAEETLAWLVTWHVLVAEEKKTLDRPYVRSWEKNVLILAEKTS